MLREGECGNGEGWEGQKRGNMLLFGYCDCVIDYLVLHLRGENALGMGPFAPVSEGDE